MPRADLRLLPVLLFLAASVSLGQAPEPDRQPVSRELAVQLALRQAQDHLKVGESKQAVEVLEAKLPWINGNRDYLATLREAYTALWKDLQRQGRDSEVPTVLEKLRLLDPAAAAPFPAEPTPKTNTIVRGKIDDPPSATSGRDLVHQAELAFNQKRYVEAEQLFSQANTLDPSCLGECRAHWAYCRLFRVVEQLKQNTANDPGQLAVWEKDVAESLNLARDNAQLALFGKKVLEQVRQRGSGSAVVPAARAVEEKVDGWTASESANFRVFHHQSAEFGARILQLAESSRMTQYERLYGPGATTWLPRCDIFLHATGLEYAKATGKQPQAPGHSTLEVNQGKVVRRRIDLVADHPSLFAGTLPHEITHVILADLFPDPLLPRWADEALAVLAEPRGNVDRYLRLMPKLKQEGRLFAVGQLIAMQDFPDPARITAFYVESVSLVDLLVSERGEKKFLIFLRDSQRYGPEQALDRNYQIKGFADLQKHWLSKIQ
jgi:tetratricopeptide (TPR) repeat protein